MSVSDPVRQFREAVERRDAEALRSVLSQPGEARAVLDEPLFDFDSPALARVAGDPDPTIVRILLEFGADPNRRTSWWAGGFHPLHSASPAAAELLIAAGAVPDACAAAHLDRIAQLRDILDSAPERVHERGGDGQTPLHFALSREVVDLLLERGADIDARDVDHRATAAEWMLAGRRGAGRYALAGYLVERGAAADIFLAIALGLTDRVAQILRADPSVLDLRTGQGHYGEQPPSSFHIYVWSIGQNLSPLQVAAQFEQDAAFDLLAAHASPRQHFLAACAGARRDEARAVLRDHPDLVGTLGAEEQRALPDAAWNGNAAAVALMLELGFDPATPGLNGATALHCAAWVGSADAVRAILASPAGRALIDRKDPTFGGTPLGWCVHGAIHCRDAAADPAAVARLLVAAGADPAPFSADAPDALRAVFEETGPPGQGAR